jgi:hypothetical protein
MRRQARLDYRDVLLWTEYPEQGRALCGPHGRTCPQASEPSSLLACLTRTDHRSNAKVLVCMATR